MTIETSGFNVIVFANVSPKYGNLK